MSFSKMNVLHLHFADFPAFRIQSLLFPSLTGKLGAQSYTQVDVRQLVEFARERGVRVVGEVDVPGHASGMRPLATPQPSSLAPPASSSAATSTAGERSTSLLKYCNESRAKTIYDDPTSQSVQVIAALIGEMAGLFTDDLFHVGGDETIAVGLCSTASFGTFEERVIAAVRSNGKTPMGWEEMFTDTGAAQPGKNFVLATWSKFNAPAAAAKGFDAVECAQGHFYIQEPIDYTRLWYDIGSAAPGIDGTSSNSNRDHKASNVTPGAVIGGEVSMWGNPWCFAGINCTRNDTPNQKPAEAGWMYDGGHDAQFEVSVWAMLLPRSVVGAHSFWRFNSSVGASDALFQARYATHAARVGQRFESTRGAGCPINCTCSAADRCGIPYPH